MFCGLVFCFLSARRTELWCTPGVSRPAPCGSWEALTFCPGAPRLTQGLHKRALLYCTWEEACSSVVWDSKIIPSTRRSPLNIEPYKFGCDLPAILGRCLSLDVASFAPEPGNPEHSCHFSCDHQRAVHGCLWQSHCPTSNLLSVTLPQNMFFKN